LLFLLIAGEEIGCILFGNIEDDRLGFLGDAAGLFNNVETLNQSVEVALSTDILSIHPQISPGSLYPQPPTYQKRVQDLVSYDVVCTIPQSVQGIVSQYSNYVQLWQGSESRYPLSLGTGAHMSPATLVNAVLETSHPYPLSAIGTSHGDHQDKDYYTTSGGSSIWPMQDGFYLPATDPISFIYVSYDTQWSASSTPTVQKPALYQVELTTGNDLILTFPSIKAIDTFKGDLYEFKQNDAEYAVRASSVFIFCDPEKGKRTSFIIVYPPMQMYMEFRKQYKPTYFYPQSKYLRDDLLLIVSASRDNLAIEKQRYDIYELTSNYSYN